MDLQDLVASFTDAWIETLITPKAPAAAPSHLLQMRGLKPDMLTDVTSPDGSHLLQMRGLKPSALLNSRMHVEVASFTDAWIETASATSTGVRIVVASFTDAWIETIRYTVLWAMPQSHLLQMRGLKHHLIG